MQLKLINVQTWNNDSPQTVTNHNTITVNKYNFITCKTASATVDVLQF